MTHRLRPSARFGAFALLALMTLPAVAQNPPSPQAPDGDAVSGQTVAPAPPAPPSGTTDRAPSAPATTERIPAGPGAGQPNSPEGLPPRGSRMWGPGPGMGPGPGPGPGMGPGMGPWGGPGIGPGIGPGLGNLALEPVLGPGPFAQVCGPQSSQRGQAYIARIEQVVKPTETQRPAFDTLKAAITKADEIMRASCPTELPLTPTGRLELMEKRLVARLEAVRTVRPPLDAFYKALDDEQKARLIVASSRQRGPQWGWRDRPREQQPDDDMRRGPWRDDGRK